jgi:hypothetical protein
MLWTEGALEPALEGRQCEERHGRGHAEAEDSEIALPQTNPIHHGDRHQGYHAAAPRETVHQSDQRDPTVVVGSIRGPRRTVRVAMRAEAQVPVKVGMPPVFLRGVQV